MTPSLLYAFAGVCLCAIGLYGFVRLAHLLRKLLAFNLIGSGVFLVMVGLAQHHNGPDPVPQALVLTGIVVAIAATALAVVLIRRYFHLSGQTTMAEPARGNDEGASQSGEDRQR
jgi:multicomponent Na+:H+ antiporter subunit C